MVDLSDEHERVVEEGARRRSRLPLYRAHRRAILEARCPLIAPMLTMVQGYAEPTTTEEILAATQATLISCTYALPCAVRLLRYIVSLYTSPAPRLR